MPSIEELRKLAFAAWNRSDELDSEVYAEILHADSRKTLERIISELEDGKVGG